nr:choice-of-anchor Q domain-containing protein [uncultured Fluviicola sp.]
MNKILLLLIFSGILLFKSNAATWYVNLNATGSNNGTSWTNAYTDLQNAIGASTFGDEIWIATGTYKPTTTSTRTISFVIKNGTKVYGGFNGTETLLSERNITTNVTVLSGGIATGAATDNSYHVVSFVSVGSQTRLDGVTITAGYSDLNYGGGIYSLDSSPIVENCRLAGNYAEDGGAIYHLNSGILTLKKCIFDGNVADDKGGALYLTATTNASDCYFKSNQGSIGGAIYINGYISSFSNCVMAGNNASVGSAIYSGANGTMNVSNSLIVGNYAASYITVGVASIGSSLHRIVNCTVAHNFDGNATSTISAAINLNNSSSIINSIIYGNNSLAQVSNSGVNMSNCIMQTGTNQATGTNISSSNPHFVLPGAFTSAPFDTTGYDYHLNALSPAIDAGLNASVVGTTDLDGIARVQNTTVDLGAYETNFCSSVLTLSPAAPYTICGGIPLNLSVTGGVAYLWSTGATTSSINVSTAGTYSIVFEDNSGCRGNLQAVVTTSSNPIPTIVFSGGSLNAGSFASYQWSFNGTSISGATGSTHVPMEGYGIYSVIVTNSGGCSGNDTYCFSPAALSATGPTSFCPGGSVTLNVTGGTGFVWSNGELDSSITVTTAGTYVVTVQNAVAGCSVSFQQVVTVFALPTPAVNHSAGYLTTTPFSTYQWNFNGTPIPGANSQNLAPTNGNGQYTVTVTNASGCSGTSVIYNYNNLGLGENTNEFVSVYPNPVAGNGTLKLISGEELGEDITILIYNPAGSIVLKIDVSALPGSIVLPGLNPGIYFMDIKTEKQNLKRLKISVI